MFINFILNLLNLIIFLNIYSFYNDFALNIEVLLFFIFIFIVLNLFIYLYSVLVNFMNVKKDEVLKEYFLSLFDLFIDCCRVFRCFYVVFWVVYVFFVDGCW